MELYLCKPKFSLALLILVSIIPPMDSVLSFTYLQSTTLKNNNILVLEKDGIYICDSNLTRVISTLYEFSEEDKIDSLSKLSKAFITKSSYMIIILANYKIYIVNTATGELVFHGENRLVTDEEPEYVTLPYIYKQDTGNFYFLFGYIDKNNALNLQYYQLMDDNNIKSLFNYTLSSIPKNSYYNQTFYFHNKGLSCNNLKDKNNENLKYLICFIYAHFNIDTTTTNCLLGIVLDKDDDKITLLNKYKIDYYKVNDINQIKSDTNDNMTIVYICYNKDDNNGNCIQFSLYKTSYTSTTKSLFKSILNTELTKECRPGIYDMRVSYIFETKDVLFTCSDTHGSFQTYFFEQGKLHLKYDNCTSIYGYSVIYLKDLSDYYVLSDVVCPEGMIPFDILINSYNYTPQIISVDSTNKESIIKSSEISNEIMTENITNAILEYTTENNIGISADKIITIQIKEITTVIINDCPEMCLECNILKECTICNKNKNYYPIELPSQENSEIVKCITEIIRQSNYPDFYFDFQNESFKLCFENCATCFGKGEQNFHNCKTCATGYIFHPDYEDSKNCVPKPNPYYYIKYDKIH